MNQTPPMKRIDIFPWDDNFNTGLSKVDEQHRQLVHLLNQLASQFAFNEDHIELDAIFNELLDYTVYHFSTEEAIWRQHLSDDASVRQHQQTHQRFIETLHRLIAEQMHKPVHEVADHTLDFLVRWLASHILESDRQMAYVVQGLQAGLTLKDATARAGERMSGFTRQMIDIILSIYGSLSRNTLRLMQELSRHRLIEAELAEARERAERIAAQNIQARAELAQQQALLKGLLQSLPDLVWLKDRDGVYLACNKRFERFFGAAEKDILGKTDYDFIDKELADSFRAHDRHAIEHGAPVVNEEWISFSDDGHRELLETTKTPMFDAQGALLGVLGIGHDVTEIRQNQQQLQHRENYLRALLDNFPFLVWLKDTQSRFLAVNQPFAEACGQPSTQALVGKSDKDIWPPDLAEGYRADDREVLRQGVSKSVEELVQNGARRSWFETYKSPVVLDGEVLGTVGYARDITDRKNAEEELRQYERIVSVTADMLALLDTNYIFIACNAAYREAFGLARDQILGHLASEIFGERFFNTVVKPHADQCLSGQPVSYQDWFDFPVTGRRYMAIHYTPYLGSGGEVLGMVVNAHDITELKQTESQLQLAASVFTHTHEGILITDLDGVILDVNQSFSRISGYSRDAVLGQNPRLLSSGKHDKTFFAAMWRALKEQGHWSGEIWNRRKNGEVYAELLTISSTRDEEGEIQRYVALFSDITALKRQQKQLEQMAHYDVLTSLPNRVLLADRMHLAMAQAQRHGELLAVVYLDLDGFKAVNDTHGHAVGDQLLTELAERMQQALRDSDTLSRLGGDEFVAVLSDLPDQEDCAHVLDRLLDAAADPVRLDALELRVSASLGVTFFPQADEVDADQLLRQADQAMYQAKQSGKNRYHIFDAEHDRFVRGRHDSLERIRQALGDQEFVLYYQPKVNMRSGQIIGAEALIRWRHPERGLLSPALFLPEIENHLLAIELGDWVLDTAMGQIENWRRAGLALPVSVNINALHLQQPDFVDRLRDKLDSHPGVQAGDLELEILETSALASITQVSQVICACRESGVSFALDDFGTGYSSLTYLKRLPASLLKIDQSFVRDMLDDPDDLAILEGVLGLASAFRRQAIAEGVETPAHGRMLLQMGCELGQGYAIARPMPADALGAWRGSWRPEPNWLHLPPVSRDDLPVLFAAVEHRAWTLAVKRFLCDEQAQPPELDGQQCRFGQWLRQTGSKRHATEPALKQILDLHQSVHRQSQALVALKQQGRIEQARSGIAAFEQQRDKLLECLYQLMA